MQSLLAVSGIVSFSLDARNMQVAPRSCRWFFLVGSTDRNRSM